jgi:hypothetical protein
MPNRIRLPLAVAVAVVAISACSTAAAPSSSPQHTPPSPSPTTAHQPTVEPTTGIDHPTGADQIVLRYEEGGGLIAVDWNLASVPIFTLYGDGTVVFRDPASQAQPDESGVLVQEPLRTAKLSEEQVQALLAFAANEGGLGVARDRYENPMIADAGAATFTINAGGRTKTVVVQALGESSEQTPDRLVRTQFKALADRLRPFDEGGAIATDEYSPRAWRAVLVESQGVPANGKTWPWPDLAPSDFKPSAGDPGSTWPAHTLDAKQVAALGLGELKGGMVGYIVGAPDEKVYSIPIRPLLPDEDA